MGRTGRRSFLPRKAAKRGSSFSNARESKPPESSNRQGETETTLSQAGASGLTAARPCWPLRHAGVSPMLHILNVGFLVLHATWVLFVCLGWIWKRTRRWHLAAVTLTALSWFGLGIWYGWGYCLCT